MSCGQLWVSVRVEAICCRAVGLRSKEVWELEIVFQVHVE